MYCMINYIQINKVYILCINLLKIVFKLSTGVIKWFIKYILVSTSLIFLVIEIFGEHYLNSVSYYYFNSRGHSTSALAHARTVG